MTENKIRVIITNKQKTVKIPTGLRMLVRRTCNAVLRMENFQGPAEVSVTFVDNAGIKELNAQYRDKDIETDVLSFPMIEYEEPGDFSVIDEESAEAFNPESGELMLGDIVISKEKVLSQAEEYGHLPKREYAFLIAHSMLHLFGYDHMVDEERVVMEAKQKEIMEKVGIFR